jgi:NitT/TauT family transport system substrate-binding protein
MPRELRHDNVRRTARRLLPDISDGRVPQKLHIIQAPLKRRLPGLIVSGMCDIRRTRAAAGLLRRGVMTLACTALARAGRAAAGCGAGPAPARRPARMLGAMLAAASLAAAAGCGGAPATAGPASLEKPDITVGVVPAVSNAGLYIAAQRGFFTAEGLHVKLAPITSSADVLAFLLHGSVDILAGNYVSEIQAEAKNPGAIRLRVLAEGALTAPHSRALMVVPGSPITTLAQLRGKTVAVNALNNAASMLVQSALAASNIPPASVHLVAIGFPDEAAALHAHRVDAAWMTEPFISEGEAKYGLRELYDTNSGATAAFPIDGYVSTQAWARKYPKTAAAFVRAIERGQRAADTDRAALEAAVVKYLHVPRQIAAIVNADSYPLGVSRVRMQRVADLMVQFGLLAHPFSMAAMTGVNR